jgi:hypothetical protein
MRMEQQRDARMTRRATRSEEQPRQDDSKTSVLERPRQGLGRSILTFCPGPAAIAARHAAKSNSSDPLEDSFLATNGFNDWLRPLGASATNPFARQGDVIACETIINLIA